jgi:signal transduction histidine kinase
MAANTHVPSTALLTNQLPFWRQLRWQLILYFIVLAIGAVVVVTTFTLIQVHNQSTQQAFRQLESVAELKENQIEQWLENADIALNVMGANLIGSDDVVALVGDGALSPEDRDLLNAALRERVEAQVHEGITDTHILEEIFIYNTDGLVLGASNDALVNRIVTLQPYFEPSIAAHYVQSPYYDVSSGELTMVITHPLYNDDQGPIVGVVAARVNIDVLRQVTAERAGLGDTGETYLVSVENNYLLTPSRFDGYDMSRAYRSEGILNALAGQNSSGIYTNYQNPPVAVLGVYHWIPELNAALMAEISEAESQVLFTQTSYLIGALGVVIALIAAVIGLYAASSISKPIRQLTGIAMQIAGGNLTQRAAVQSSNEIGVLSDAFNQMTGQLSQTIAELDNKVSELNETNDELRIATAKAREAARVKGEFLANVSHELRTPLNAIIGFSDMLLMGMSGELNPKQHHKLERLRENGARLLNLINDILDITRIEARRIEIISKPFAPRALMERLSAQMAVLAEQNKLDLTVGIDSSIPEIVIGDEKRIEQVIVNMLSNAFKFTEQGLVTLDVHSSPHEPTWSIVVSDTGIGIPPHAVNIIFEEFRQVDGGGTRAYKGSGLGLAITRNLVRMMDGQISVQSEIGKGSVFTVTLPLVTPESAKLELAESVEA